MTDSVNIRWGSYREFSGPWYSGTISFELPDDPTEDEKILAVVTATEGGRYDAINMYDRMILSIGLIQFAEAGQFMASQLLGACRKAGAPMDRFKAECRRNGCTFELVDSDKWRFRLGELVVDTIKEQQQLFLGGSSGRTDAWDSVQRQTARQWAAAIATDLQHPRALAAQKLFTVDHLMGFVMPAAKKMLFSDELSETPELQAARAAYVSFAANNPTIAQRSLMATGYQPTEPGFLVDVLRRLTFHSGIAIYPDRYNKIRPVLERCYGVDLPDFAAELRVPAHTPSIVRLQEMLLVLGFDLGPAGADGVVGRKTTDAIMTFQSQQRMTINGLFDHHTVQRLQALTRPGAA